MAQEASTSSQEIEGCKAASSRSSEGGSSIGITTNGSVSESESVLNPEAEAFVPARLKEEHAADDGETPKPSKQSFELAVVEASETDREDTPKAVKTMDKI